MAESSRGSASAFASIDQIPVIVWEVDVATFRFLYVSAYAEALLGFPIERWYQDGEFFWNQIHEADRETTRATCKAATERGEDHLLEYRMFAADGRMLWIRDHVRVWRDADGRAARLVGVMVDMTEERRTQLERESIGRVARLLIETRSIDEIYRELPRLLIEHSDFPVAGILLGHEDDEDLWCVGAAAVEGLRGGIDPALDTPLHIPAKQSISGEAIRSGKTVVATDIATTRPQLHPAIRAQLVDTVVSVPLRSGARTLGALSLGAPGHRDVQPSTLHALEIIASLLAHQIERHETQRALRVREQALEAIAHAVVITDQLRPGTPVVYASPSFERLVGRPPAAEILPAAYLHASADPAVVADFRAAVKDQRPCQCELDLVRGDGLPLKASIAFAPVRDAAGRVTHHVAIFDDVTARRHLEMELGRAQKIEALGRLAGGIAHDFNNLLTVVVGYGDQLLQQLLEGDPRRADVEEIRKAGERGARLTRQLLAFSRRQIARPEVLDLNEILRDMQPMFERLLREDVRLAVELVPGAALVRADRGQIEQVVMNLVLNARDAMPRGGQLTLLTRRRAAPEDRGIELAITDSGPGIDARTRARMFDPFFTTKEHGTGLGLATVYGIVTQSGGTVDIESAPAKGTTVTVRLPEADPVSPKPGPPAPARRQGGGGETILLVEDDPLVRRVSRDGLERAGFHVIVAARADEALAAFSATQAKIDLVATDIVMPGMSGIDLARRLEKSRPGTRFVFTTGFAEPALAAKRPAGSVLLQKPFSAAALVEAIRTLLDTAPSTGAAASGTA